MSAAAWSVGPSAASNALLAVTTAAPLPSAARMRATSMAASEKRDPSLLVRDADALLYEAKAAGRDRYVARGE